MPALVFAAFTDPHAKSRWFPGEGGFQLIERRMDLREGGREHLSGRWPNGVVSRFDAIYLDVIPDARLVYAYELPPARPTLRGGKPRRPRRRSVRPGGLSV